MSTATAPTTSRRLYRSTRDSRLGGVCGGIAEVMGWDPTTVRLVAALSLLLPGPQAIAYLVAWAIIPTDATVFGWNNQSSPHNPHPPAPAMPTPPVTQAPPTSPAMQQHPTDADTVDGPESEAAEAFAAAQAEVDAADVTMQDDGDDSQT